MRQTFRRFSRAVTCIFAAVALLAPSIARATNYQDLWWSSPPGSESGWGVNIAHQADTLFATWFIYDSSGNAAWVVMSDGAKIASSTYSGLLYRTTGPAYSAATFNPANVTVTEVGRATFTFTSAYQGSLSYTLDGVTVNKTIARQTFKVPPLAGTYRILEHGQTTGCTRNPSWNGSLDSADVWMNFSVNGNAVSAEVTKRNSSGAIESTFLMTGTFTQYGSLIAMTLRQGTAYTFELIESQVTEFGLMGKAVGRSGDDTCVDETVFSALRQ